MLFGANDGRTVEIEAPLFVHTRSTVADGVHFHFDLSKAAGRRATETDPLSFDRQRKKHFASRPSNRLADRTSPQRRDKRKSNRTIRRRRERVETLDSSSVDDQLALRQP